LMTAQHRLVMSMGVALGVIQHHSRLVSARVPPAGRSVYGEYPT
jgi:hypothetical protein